MYLIPKPVIKNYVEQGTDTVPFRLCGKNLYKALEKVIHLFFFFLVIDKVLHVYLYSGSTE